MFNNRNVQVPSLFPPKQGPLEMNPHPSPWSPVHTGSPSLFTQNASPVTLPVNDPSRNGSHLREGLRLTENGSILGAMGNLGGRLSQRLDQGAHLRNEIPSSV